MTYYLTGKKNRYTRQLEALLQASDCQPAEAGGVDLFVYTICPEPCQRDDWEVLCSNYQETAVGLLREVHDALPRMQEGKKRLCFLTSTRSSVNLTTETQGWEKSILAACNMAIATLFNRLNGEGFTFRIFAAEDFETEDPSYALSYFLADRSLETESARHSDENRLIIRNRAEQEIPW